MAFVTAGALLDPERLDTPGQPAPAAISAKLREEILRGLIPAGDRMRQDAVATRFGVSQNTAREAFRILEADGLLRSEPRRGVSVAMLSAAEAWEITELRSLLEVQVLGWAFPSHTAGCLGTYWSVFLAISEANTAWKSSSAILLQSGTARSKTLTTCPIATDWTLMAFLVYQFLICLRSVEVRCGPTG